LCNEKIHKDVLSLPFRSRSRNSNGQIATQPEPAVRPSGRGQQNLSLGGCLPPAIKQALVNELGDGKVVDMVPRDADFQETDLIESPDGPLSFHRFIQAGHSGTRWCL
jgi:hypothetical protein